MNLKRTLGLLGLLGVSLLAGCKGPAVLSEGNLLPHMKKPALVLFGSRPVRIPRPEWEQLTRDLEARLTRMPQFGDLVLLQTQQQRWQEVAELKPSQTQYQTTLVLTGVSDKELADTLRQSYQIEQVVVFHLESYSCTRECPATRQWLLRLIVLDVQTGKPVYRIRMQHQLTQEEEDPEQTVLLAQRLTSELFDQFEQEFTVPWHQWRFEHLKPEPVRTARPSLGI